MIQWLSGFIDRLFVVAGALVFSQAPQYFNQYMHRLTGHSEELKIHIRSIQQAAAKNGLELPEYLGTFTRHQDSIINSHGILMEEMFSRYSALSQASLALQESTPLTRPFIFIRSHCFTISARLTFDYRRSCLRYRRNGNRICSVSINQVHCFSNF